MIESLALLIALWLFGDGGPQHPVGLQVELGALVHRWRAAMETAPGELAALRERLREAGEPLELEELPLPEVEHDATQWLAEIGRRLDGDLPGGAPLDDELTGEIERLAESGEDPGRLERVRVFAERVRELHELHPDDADRVEDHWRSLYVGGLDPPLPAPLHPGDRAYLELEIARFDPIRPLADRVLELDGFDLRRVLAAWDGNQDFPPAEAVAPLMQLSELFSMRIALAAADGDVAALSLELQRLERLADLAQTSVGVAYHAWRLLLGRTLGLLEAMSPSLDRDLDLHLRWLEAQHPHASLETWLRQERAIGLRLFRGQADPQGMLGPMLDVYGLFGLGTEPDELFFLRSLERQLEYVRLAWPDSLGRSSAPEFPRGLPDLMLAISSFVIPVVDPVYAGTFWLETELLFAQATLRARRDGPAAARAWLATRRDPYSGEPLRQREEADGTLVLWSVGPDLVDQGGLEYGDVDLAAQIEGRYDVTYRLPPD